MMPRETSDHADSYGSSLDQKYFQSFPVLAKTFFIRVIYEQSIYIYEEGI